MASALHQVPQASHTTTMPWIDSLYTPPPNLLDPGHKSPAATTTSLSVLMHVCPIPAPLGTSFPRRTTTSDLVSVSGSVSGSVRAADLRKKVVSCKLRLAQRLVWQLPWVPLVT